MVILLLPVSSYLNSRPIGSIWETWGPSGNQGRFFYSKKDVLHLFVGIVQDQFWLVETKVLVGSIFVYMYIDINTYVCEHICTYKREEEAANKINS